MGKLTIRYNNPDLPKGTEIDIPGVALIKNGSQVTVEDDVLERYEAENGVSLEKALAENPNFANAPDETKGEKSAAKVAAERGEA